MKKNVASLIILFLIAKAVMAQHNEPHNDSHHDTKHHDEHHDDHHHDDHHAHKHHIALFGGAATNFNHHETKPGVGIDYERILSKKFGLGLVAEVEFTEKPSYLVSIPVFFHPVKGLKVYGGPAAFSLVEHHAEEEDPLHTDHHAAEREIQYGGRIGIAYDFTIGKVTIGPSVNYAISKSTALIYGINIGIGL